MNPIDTTVAWLTFRQLFVRRRFILAVLFSLVPAILAVVYRLAPHGGPALAPNMGAPSTDFLQMLYRGIVVGTLLPLAAVVFGTSAFGGEMDDGTIVYLLVKPLARWRVLFTKFVVAIVSTLFVIVPALLLPWLILGMGTIAVSVPLGFAAAIGVGAVLYCALFVTLGLTSKRALVLGLLYIVLLEFVLSTQVAGAKSISIREFVITIAGVFTSSAPGGVAGTVPMQTVWTMGAIILVGALAFGIYKLRRYEMAERL